MRKLLLIAVLTIIVSANLPPALADIVTFDFTGRMTITDNAGNAIPNFAAEGMLDPRGLQTPISASLTFNTKTGIGSSNLVIDQINLFDNPAAIYDINFTQLPDTNLINGTFLFDSIVFGYNEIGHIQWDATGMINAFNYGLQVGDKISGTVLYRDFNHDGQYDASEIVVPDLGSVIPYTDYGVRFFTGNGIWNPDQGPAPMAATINTEGFVDPFLAGLAIYMDIGSGNSMYVTSIQTVPLPPAIWLFGFGLFGLIGMARKKS